MPSVFTDVRPRQRVPLDFAAAKQFGKQQQKSKKQATPTGKKRERKNLLGTRPESQTAVKQQDVAAAVTQPQTNDTTPTSVSSTSQLPSSTPATPVTPSRTRLCLKNIPTFVTNDTQLRAQLLQMLPDLRADTHALTDCHLLKTRDGVTRKIAFLGFNNAELTDIVARKLRGVYLGTSRMHVEYATPVQRAAKAEADATPEQRPWSKYSEGSSRHDNLKRHEQQSTTNANGDHIDLSKLKAREAKKIVRQRQIQRRTEMFLLGLPNDRREQLKSDPKWTEFLAVHGVTANPMQSQTSSTSNTTSSAALDAAKKTKFWSNDDDYLLARFDDFKQTNQNQLQDITKDMLDEVSDDGTDDDEYFEPPIDNADAGGDSVERDNTPQEVDASVYDEAVDDAEYFKKRQSNAAEWSDDEADGHDANVVEESKAESSADDEFETQQTVYNNAEQTNQLFGMDEDDSSGSSDSDGDSDRDGEQAEQAAKDESIDDVFGHKNKAAVEQPEADDTAEHSTNESKQDAPEAAIASSALSAEQTGRLRIVNLPYSVTVDDIKQWLQPYDEMPVVDAKDAEATANNIVEVHIPTDDTKQSRGYAFVQFTPHATHIAALAQQQLNKTIYLGRVVHIEVARPKPQQTASAALLQMSDNEFNALSYKQQQELLVKKQNELDANPMNQQNKPNNWNSLFIRSDTVIDATAARLGMKRSQVLDLDNTDGMAVRVALAETQVIDDTKQMLKENGVSLAAFAGDRRTTPRSNTTMLVKNLPFDTTEQELRSMFGKHGAITRLVLPASRAIAIIEYDDTNDAKRAFAKLAYTQFKRVPVYLEWAPQATFKQKSAAAESALTTTTDDQKAAETPAADTASAASVSGSTIYVTNLSFDTTDDTLQSVFSALGTVRSAATVKVQKAGKSLSRGYGFVEYATAKDAARAVKALNGKAIDGHEIVVKLSDRPANENSTSTKDSSHAGTKLTVKNVPFEANERELAALFKPFGQLKHKPRMPRKFDGSHRGFAFIEFVSRKEAVSALRALHNTHLYGRKMVLEWSKEDSTSSINADSQQLDVDVEAIQERTAKQFSKQRAADAVATQAVAKRRKI